MATQSETKTPEAKATETKAPEAKSDLAFPAPSEYKGLAEGVKGGAATLDNPEKTACHEK